MGQRFRRVIAQLGGDRNPRVTVDHKGVVRVVDDCCKFHLQNSVELLNDGTNVKLESPSHGGFCLPWMSLISRRSNNIGFQLTGNERASLKAGVQLEAMTRANSRRY